jgi:hypothetical protein
MIICEPGPPDEPQPPEDDDEAQDCPDRAHDDLAPQLAVHRRLLRRFEIRVSVPLMAAALRFASILEQTLDRNFAQS